MVDDIKPHIIGITESWANKDITNAELGLEGHVMFRTDRIGRRGGGVLLYIKDTIPAYEVQLQEEADCNEAIWCNLVTGHTAVIIGVVYRCPNITKQNNEKIHNAINEVSKGDCIIMGDFNHGNIKWDTLQSTGTGQFPNSTCISTNQSSGMYFNQPEQRKIKESKITRGHNYTLVKKQSRLDVRKYSFSQRTINLSLPRFPLSGVRCCPQLFHRLI